MPTAARITIDSDLDRLVAEINDARWDDANDLVSFSTDDLRAFVGHPDHVFVACHDRSATLLGIASGRLCLKPYGRERWLYVDEVDVVADRRRTGAGRAMMEALLGIGRRAGCREAWLGTEHENTAARGLYDSLSPSDREPFVGYTWDLAPGGEGPR